MLIICNGDIKSIFYHLYHFRRYILSLIRSTRKGQLKKSVNSSWKTVSVRTRPQDLPVFNQRLRLYGFETLGQLVADFLTTKLLPLTEDRQIQAMESITQSFGLKTLINGVSFDLSSILGDRSHSNQAFL
jgi:hypothetical protein